MNSSRLPPHAVNVAHNATIDDPGDGEAIPAGVSGYCSLVGGDDGAQTRTLPDPVRIGVVLRLYVNSIGDGIQVICDTAYDDAGHTKLAFNSTGAWAVLEAFPGNANHASPIWRCCPCDDEGWTPQLP